VEKPQGKQDLQSPTVWAMFVTFTNVVLFSFIYGDVRPSVLSRHFQQNDAEWIFSLQGGGMRRSGGYVD